MDWGTVSRKLVQEEVDEKDSVQDVQERRGEERQARIEMKIAVKTEKMKNSSSKSQIFLESCNLIVLMATVKFLITLYSQPLTTG